MPMRFKGGGEMKRRREGGGEIKVRYNKGGGTRGGVKRGGKIKEEEVYVEEDRKEEMKDRTRDDEEV